jgi:hypothetical protein
LTASPKQNLLSDSFVSYEHESKTSESVEIRGAYKDLIQAAWRELQYVQSYYGDFLVVFGKGVPGWFIREELGFADHGISLAWTMTQLAAMNQRALQQLGHEAPKKVSWPKNFIDVRKKKRKAR